MAQWQGRDKDEEEGAKVYEVHLDPTRRNQYPIVLCSRIITYYYEEEK